MAIEGILVTNSTVCDFLRTMRTTRKILLLQLGFIIVSANSLVEGQQGSTKNSHRHQSGKEVEYGEIDGHFSDDATRKGIIAYLQEKKETAEEWTNSPKTCVTLLVYRDDECTGDPVRKISFRTWNEAGSPCCK